jgi:hypothetical protein
LNAGVILFWHPLIGLLLSLLVVGAYSLIMNETFMVYGSKGYMYGILGGLADFFSAATNIIAF